MCSIESTCNAEVHHFDRAVITHEDVRRLDVSVHHIVAVCISKCVGNGSCHHGGRAGNQFALATKSVCQSATLHVFHRHEIGVAGLAPVIDTHNVRVVEAGHGLSLAAEALDEIGVHGVLGEEDLHCYIAVEEEVAGNKYVGHAASANTGAKFIAIIDDRGVLVRHKTLFRLPVSHRATEAGQKRCSKGCWQLAQPNDHQCWRSLRHSRL